MGMGSLTGGGGLSSSSAAASGDAKGQSGSGNKVFNFGVNPANANTSASIVELFGNPFVLLTVGVLGVIWVSRKKRR